MNWIRNYSFASLTFLVGPNFSTLRKSLVKREIARTKERDSSSMSDRPRVSTEEKNAVLSMDEEVMAGLDTGTITDKFSQPVLWHTDLHMGIIFASSEDPTKVISLIGWQSISVPPLLLQAQFPYFLSVYPDFVLN